MATPGGVDQARRRLRVMTYNIHGGRGLDKRIDLGRIAGVVASFGPDVVALQEVDCGHSRSDAVDQAAVLAGQLGMEPIFAPCLARGGGWSGIATLTRLPLLTAEQVELPTRAELRRSEPRRALVTRLTWTPGASAHRRPSEDGAAAPMDDQFEVVNTHLSVRSGERKAQAEAIACALGSRAMIVAGDLNCSGRSRPFRALCCGLREAAPGARSWPALFPVVQFDHILYRGGLDVLAAGAWSAGGARRASDHLPVVAEFAWESA
jgi:endonuclease/exonuclease/phosphatase family metal-dependent hydrolase